MMCKLKKLTKKEAKRMLVSENNYNTLKNAIEAWNRNMLCMEDFDTISTFSVGSKMIPTE